MTRREFKKLAREMIDPQVTPLGFTEYEVGYFKRPRGDIQDVFFLDPTRDVTNFYVQIGIHVPSLRQKDVFVDGINQPVAMISHRLGEFSNPPRSNRSWGCANLDQLNKYVPRMLEEFKAHALPWYEKFRTLPDVAAEFRRCRIDDPPELRPKGVGPRPADPFAWSLYGWMLEEGGKPEEARRWLQKAHDEMGGPLWIKSGVPVAPNTKGARSTRRSVVEERLAELLRQSLGIPLNLSYPE